MKNLFVFFFLVSCSVTMLISSPCTIVNEPQHIVFTDLKDFSSFLYHDLMETKDVVNMVMVPPFNKAGKAIAKAKFKKIGLPDPVVDQLQYSIVAKPAAGLEDKINCVVVLKGAIDREKLLAYSRKRYGIYMKSLVKRKLVQQPAQERSHQIKGIESVVFPFAERASEMVYTSFDDYHLVSMVPEGHYGVIEKTIDVLKGVIPYEKQPDHISYQVGFGITEKETKQIKGFESTLDKFKTSTRDTYKKLMNKAGVDLPDKSLETSDEKVRNSLLTLEKVNYRIECDRQGSNYIYTVKFTGICQSEEMAQEMKEIFTEQLVKASASCITDEDRIAFENIKAYSNGAEFIAELVVSSERQEQYDFASMIITLFFQDRRFTKWFHL